MKKTCILFFSIIIFIFSSCTTVRPVETNPIYKTIECEGKTADELFSLSKEWISNKLITDGSSITKINELDYSISGFYVDTSVGYWRTLCLKASAAKYSITIQVKDNRVRLSILLSEILSTEYSTTTGAVRTLNNLGSQWDAPGEVDIKNCNPDKVLSSLEKSFNDYVRTDSSNDW